MMNSRDHFFIFVGENKSFCDESRGDACEFFQFPLRRGRLNGVF